MADMVVTLKELIECVELLLWAAWRPGRSEVMRSRILRNTEGGLGYMGGER